MDRFIFAALRQRRGLLVAWIAALLVLWSFGPCAAQDQPSLNPGIQLDLKQFQEQNPKVDLKSLNFDALKPRQNFAGTYELQIPETMEGDQAQKIRNAWQFIKENCRDCIGVDNNPKTYEFLKPKPAAKPICPGFDGEKCPDGLVYKAPGSDWIGADENCTVPPWLAGPLDQAIQTNKILDVTGCKRTALLSLLQNLK